MDIETAWAFVSENWEKITSVAGVISVGSAGLVAWLKKRKAGREKRAADQKRKQQIELYLDGLPISCKAALGEFLRRRSHTVALDALDDAVSILVRQGVLIEGPRVNGSYASRHYTLKPEFRPFVVGQFVE